MKSTLVKDMGASLLNLTAAQTGKSTGAGEFQKVWSSQMSKSSRDSQTAPDRQGAVKAAAGRPENDGQMQSKAASKIQEGQTVRGQEPEAVEELSPEEMEEAMEVMAAAAMELMQEIADAFGITVEELQAVMDEMNLKPMDLLDSAALGDLVIQLGGGDSYALVTDGELYSKYQKLMEQLQGTLEESAQELGMEPEAVVRLAKEGFGAETTVEETEAVRQEPDMTDVDSENSAAEGVENGSQKMQGAEDTQNAQNAASQENGQARGEGRQPGARTAEGDHPNLFIQNLRTEQFQPGAVQGEAVVQGSSWSEQTQNIMNQIMDYMRIQLGADTTSLEMQLHPASLGTLQVQIASKGGVVTANFITQNEAVKAALESQMVQLKESFEEQGVKIEAIEVTVQTHEFERNLEQGRGRNQQEPERRGRARRINLGDPLSMETMAEEDELTAEMMAMEGSTVDYMA